LTLGFVVEGADAVFSNATQPKPRPPIGNLPNSNSINSLINPPNPLSAINPHESSKRARRFNPRFHGLVLGDLDGFHARAESHGRVGLCETARHAAADARDEVGGAEGFGVEFGFRGDEEEDGAFG